MIKYNREQIIDYLYSSEGKTYGFLGLTIFVVVISLVFAIQPSISSILTEKTQLDADSVVSTTLQTNIDALKTLQNIYSTNVLPNKAILTEALPKDSSIPSILTNIYELVKISNLTLGGLNFSSSPPTNIVQATYLGTQVEAVSISVTGKQSDIISFINLLENYPRSFSLNSISLVSQVKADPNNSSSSSTTKPILTGLYTAGIDCLTYYSLN